MFTLLAIVAALLLIGISLGVYYRRRGNQTNLIFMFLTLSLAAWSFTNYLAITIPQNNSTIYAIRTVLLFAAIENTLFYFFARTFPSTKFRDLPFKNKLLLAYSALVVLLLETPLIFNSITLKNGKANPNAKPLILLFIIHALITIVAGFTQLVAKYKREKGQAKRQLLFILIASVVLWLVVPITNFAITLSAQTTTFIKLSPFYALVFGIFITYAIVAQKLFDIKAAVARSVAYVMLLVAIVGIYGVVIFGIVDSLVDNSRTRQIFSLLLILPLAISFHSFKLFFDRVTNRIFYRDSYDPQQVLDNLGSVMVAEIDLHKILESTRQILSEAFKSNFIEFILIENREPELKISKNQQLQNNFAVLKHHLREQRRDILEVETAGRHNLLRQEFIDNGVAVSLRLKTQQQIVGFILFGEKRSGDIYTSQDLKLLTIIANELAVAIQNALRFEEIQQFNITLQEKINEATKQLRHANIRLKELDRTKDEFISMASHQLRTPLTTIKGYLSMILDGDIGPVTKNEKQMIQQAFDSAERMVFLIADLLNVSRLQSGKFVIDNKPTDLAKMVEDQTNQLQETAKNHHLTLSYKKPDKFPMLNLDDTKVQQVVMNFMDNAIFYTPAGGSIDVALEATPDSINYTVTDTGLGVPAAEQHHLFAKFYRAGNARKMRPDGTGLGLFMAKKVIAAQGGAIIFKSTEGKGSTFGFSFPRHAVEIKQ
jgi:signal transduction histidine kinase